MRDEYGSARRSFLTGSLLTRLELATMVGSHCRVCTKPIALGEEQRRREWGIEKAHAACGWFRPEEVPADSDPPRPLVHARTRPGTAFRFWEWQCPACGLDATSSLEPDDGTEVRCRRCAPDQDVIAAGKRVELRVGVFYDAPGPRGGKAKRYRIHTGARARALSVDGELVRVQWLTPKLGPDVALPAAHFRVV